MSSILTNNSAMVALDTLRGINKSLGNVQSEISTGKKISSSTDNAAIWSISTVMQADVQSFSQVSDSLNLGSATVGVAQNGANEVTDLLKDVKASIVAANDPSVSDADRAKYQADITEFAGTIGSIVDAASFNGTNLLKGTDSVSVLSSLNRAADGSVTTGSVTVERQDLSTTAAVAASNAITASTVTDSSAGGVTFADGTLAAGIQANNPSSGQDGFITIGTAAIGNGESSLITIDGGPDAVSVGSTYAFDVAGTTVSYTAVEGDDINDITAGLLQAVNNNTTLQTAGFTATTGTDAADPLVNDATFNVNNVSAGAGQAVDGQATAIAAQARTELVTINGGDGAVTEGSTYSFDIGGTSVEYTAAAGDDINDVNAGIVAAINVRGINGVSAAVTTPAADASANDATFTLSNTTGSAITVDNASSSIAARDAIEAVAGGGLSALADLDVSTAAGATAALSAIDGLLQTAIDATAAFGSKQSRLDNQNEFITKLSDSLKTGIGALTDANLEEASARLQSLQVQQQLGVQALSIANQGPQQLLALFR